MVNLPVSSWQPGELLATHSQVCLNTHMNPTKASRLDLLCAGGRRGWQHRNAGFPRERGGDPCAGPVAGGGADLMGVGGRWWNGEGAGMVLRG